MEEIIKKNINAVFSEIKNGNNFGEEITVVGASKFVEDNVIRLALKNGLKILGDNKVQEFRDKTSLIDGAEYHFIGRLQTNKVKYLIGKVSLIQSVDSIRLASEISRLSTKNNVTTNVLLEVNPFKEESKGGFLLDEVELAIKEIADMPNVTVKGLMAMLPDTDNEDLLVALCDKTRALYDKLKNDGYPFTYLSMGMSGDYKLTIKHGANMIRLGTILFGARDYTK